MKTFSEACKSVFLSSKLEESTDVATTRLVIAQEKRLEIVEEVTTSEEAHFLAASMLKHAEDDKDESYAIINCLLNMFAQGVLVGMEMEKEEIQSENSNGNSYQNQES
jgi:hypothetical protein